jgi:magnesium-protoporphyrin IX monomethyl ester (oxidative) cyclase
VANPRFWEGLERLVQHNAALAQAETSPSPAPLKLLRKIPHWVGNGLEMAKLFFMAPIRSERFQPAVR